MARTSVQPKFYESPLLWSFILVLAVVLSATELLWRLDFVFYDAQLRLWQSPSPEDIIIVAIDEQSLREIGSWPWSRSIHARMIEQLHAAGAKVIGLDILFAEPSTNEPAADAQLAQAITQHGNTVLPVAIEEIQFRRQLIDTVPISILYKSAVALGHVHVDLDRDGIARRTFLTQGLGAHSWQHFAVMILESIGQPMSKDIRLQHRPDTVPISQPIVRDKQLLIAFAGPPGHFKQISYVEVLNHTFDPNIFKDKIVLVGATATGLGDALPTPTSADKQPMPGVEINAHIIDALRLGRSIEPLNSFSTALLTGMLVLLPAFLFVHFTPRWNLIVTLLLIFTTILANLFLIKIFYLWFPPAAAILCLAISYPLWSWRRLEHALRFLNRELNTLQDEQAKLPAIRTPPLEDAMLFLRQLLPIKGWIVYHPNGSILMQKGTPPHPLPKQISNKQWSRTNSDLWINLATKEYGIFGIAWKTDEPQTPNHLARLGELVGHYHQDPPNSARETDLIYSRIQQVQTATNQMRALSRFVANTVSQMANGTLVVDSTGTVILTNPRAGQYLFGINNNAASPYLLQDCLAALALPQHLNWADVLHHTLSGKNPVPIEARSRAGIDLLVQIAPLSPEAGLLSGFIVNLSDISLLKESERKRDELLSFLTHDLRSPLVSLLALIEIGKNKYLDPNILSLMDQMQHHTQRTLTLADQFLQLARAESKDEITLEVHDFIALIHACLAELITQANNKQIKIQLQTELEQAWVTGDGNLLQRAVTNLVANAIKYSPSHSSITILIQCTEKEIRCSVNDQGIGMEEDEIPTLFDRFRRAKHVNQTQQSGVGLGLAIVKAVTDRHNGRIEVQSKLGLGTQITLILPKSSSDLTHDQAENISTN